jgi:hypothetical protein
LTQAAHNAAPPSGEEAALRILLHDVSILSSVIQRAEAYRQALGRVERPKIAEEETIEFRLA